MARILIVENNPDNMELAVFLLQSAGHTVLSAKDAEAGLALARQPRMLRQGWRWHATSYPA